MSIKIIILATVVALVASKSFDGDKKYSHISHEKNDHHIDIPHDYYAYPKYSFDYGVKDFKTGDYKMHKEERDGDVIKGEYTVSDPDGTIRTVTYTVTKRGGFQAVVQKSGNDHQEYNTQTSYDFVTPGYKHENEYEVKYNMKENKAVYTMKKSLVASSQDHVNSVVDTTKMKIEGKEAVDTMKNAAFNISNSGNSGYNRSFDVMAEKKLEGKNASEMIKKSTYKNYEQLHQKQYQQKYPVMQQIIGKQQRNPNITMLEKPKEYIPQHNGHRYDGYSQISMMGDGNKIIVPRKQKLMDTATEQKH